MPIERTGSVWRDLTHVEEGRAADGLDRAEMAFFAGLQNILFLKEKPVPKRMRRICAVDASYSGSTVAAVATEFVDGEMTEQGIHLGSFTFPYVRGLLYLHEGPSVVEAVRRLELQPQLVCFDAHGTAHPRSAGLARICGMVLGIPSIGIAKSLLAGEVTGSGEDLGRMVYDGNVVGFVTGRHGGTRYWSPGYSVRLKELESLIGRYGDVCLSAMAESHRRARLEMRSRRP